MHAAGRLRCALDRFWEELADDDEFLSAGRPRRNRRLMTIIKRACRRIIGSDDIQLSMLIHLSQHSFWHGYCLLAGVTIQVMYFEDDDLGLIIIADPTPSLHVDLIRFKLQRAADNGKPSLVIEQQPDQPL